MVPENEERIRTDAKIRGAKHLADGIRQLRMVKAIRPLSEGEQQELDNKLTLARDVLGMSGNFELQEVLDGIETYIVSLEATRP